ncbi:hypothetical protein CEXT_369111 [Caerostris extrusa]|uniref:Uncharacterized protein n=1 Tax=Caerostris extrusa TaxID=172846 RepID=A0AAV4QXE5_CAEEX|nr:hypothetical protein CEXT_369111 [Caerostris extrusa]
MTQLKPEETQNEEAGKLFVGGLSWETTQETVRLEEVEVIVVPAIFNYGFQIKLATDVAHSCKHLKSKGFPLIPL